MKFLLGVAVVLLLIAYAGWRYNLFDRRIVWACAAAAAISGLAYLLTHGA